MSRIQLPSGEAICENRETAKLDLPKKYCASEYFKFLLYLHDFKKLNFQISINNAINNRHQLYFYLENIGKSIQEN